MTGALRQVRTVWRKELLDASRDRRALVSVGLSIVLGPLFAGLMLMGAAERQRDVDHVRLPVAGAEHAPALVAWLARQDGVAIVAAPAEPERAVRAGTIDLAIIVPDDFASRFRESRPIDVRLVTDSSRRTAQPAAAYARRLLEAYNAEISALRLIARGMSPAAVTAVRVAPVDVSTPQQRAADILTFIPMFIIMAGFAGGMQIATDSTAGERERGSFEPLLLNPAPRGALVTGKWLAAASVAVVTTLTTTALCLALPRVVPFADLGLRVDLPADRFVGIAAAAVPLCLLSSALQLCIATFARSFKEAQTYMGLLLLIPAVPGLLNALFPFGASAWMYVVPVWGPYTLLTAVIGHESPGAAPFVASAASSCAAALLLARVTTGLFRNERIIFAR